MNKFIVLGVIALVLSTGSPVLASDEDGRVRKLTQEQPEKAGSREGLVKRFFDNIRSRAAIGTGTISTIDTAAKSFKVTKDGKDYTVLTDDKTQFRYRFGAKGAFSDLVVGHQVNVIGLWTNETKTTVQAKLVRDMAIQKRFGVFIGKVLSVNANGWVMTTVSGKRSDQTVTVTSDTKFVNREEKAITQAEILLGHRIRVKGLWDRVNNTVTNVTHVKDFDLPVRPTPTTTP